MKADAAIAILTGAEVMVLNRDLDKFVEAVNRGILALHKERQNQRQQERPKTELERIQTMDKKDLALFLCNLMSADGCYTRCPAKEYCSSGRNGMAAYLSSPAKED